MTTLALPTELCRHWDRIPAPNGSTSAAVCEKCGREKVYNTPYEGPYSAWLTAQKTEPYV